jgi:hypothetical protein
MNVVDKCIAALSGLTAKRQAGAEAALGITASHKAMSRAYSWLGYRDSADRRTSSEGFAGLEGRAEERVSPREHHSRQAWRQ